MITPYDDEIRKSRATLKIVCDKKDYVSVREELDHLHVLYINAEISYCHIISKTQKVLNRKGISENAKSMIEFMLSDLEKDNEKVKEGLREIIKKQDEWNFFYSQIEKMKRALIFARFGHPELVN
jgi:hypothetical protein